MCSLGDALRNGSDKLEGVHKNDQVFTAQQATVKVNKGGQGQGRGRVCLGCGSTEHIIKDCPQKRPDNRNSIKYEKIIHGVASSTLKKKNGLHQLKDEAITATAVEGKCLISCLYPWLYK
ncbi:unnamed protein product [Vitrella brassicaformis CCMP3155]|uniref:CCHC-type domain-containing protein n=1 Tax=Vitrella brassicaformis (strain CCMP3155) TaxID=1169540 RepID=A0A0G4FG87_VITBC|nr:unnamed protein product [Vitrella brassicaformis CCMP3155]|eukprot:CEM12079.1 unnamed protein product [Vitrella brassicaformis CCMP3155]